MPSRIVGRVTISIRRATTGDLTAVLGLVSEYCVADRHIFDPGLATAGIGPLLADDRYGTIWLAHDGDRPEGYAAVTWGWSLEVGGLDVVLDEIYVRERGKGTGSLLLAALERDCRERGVKRIVMETERPNDDARRLYRRHGYVTDTSIWMSKDIL